VQPYISSFQPLRDRRSHLAQTEESEFHVLPPAGG